MAQTYCEHKWHFFTLCTIPLKHILAFKRIIVYKSALQAGRHFFPSALQSPTGWKAFLALNITRTAVFLNLMTLTGPGDADLGFADK